MSLLGVESQLILERIEVVPVVIPKATLGDCHTKSRQVVDASLLLATPPRRHGRPRA